MPIIKATVCGVGMCIGTVRTHCNYLHCPLCLKQFTNKKSLILTKDKLFKCQHFLFNNSHHQKRKPCCNWCIRDEFKISVFDKFACQVSNSAQIWCNRLVFNILEGDTSKWPIFLYRTEKHKSEQDCIPVGCLPPARWPYLPACSARGGGCLLRGVSAPAGCLLGGGGWYTSMHWGRQPPPWTEWQNCPVAGGNKTNGSLNNTLKV